MSFGPFKKDLTPLSKGGSVHKHAGKGHSPFQASPPGPGGRNDFSKPAPTPAPMAGAGGAGAGMGPPIPPAPMMNPAQSGPPIGGGGGGPGRLGGI